VEKELSLGDHSNIILKQRVKSRIKSLRMYYTKEFVIKSSYEMWKISAIECRLNILN